MIKTIKHKGLKKLFTKNDSSGVQPAHIARLRLLLSRLDDANVINDWTFRVQICIRLKMILKGIGALK
nr:hypothetical protein [Ostreibacterium oceani]